MRALSVFAIASFVFLQSMSVDAMPHYDDAVQRALAWLNEPPWYDQFQQARQPNFSYEAWAARGRKLPHVVGSLVVILDAQDASKSSDVSMRATYALGMIGDKSTAVSDALVRMLRNPWPITSIHAASALGTQADAQGVRALEKILADRTVDGNTRGNAAASLAMLAPPEAREVLRRQADDPDPTVRRSVALALRELSK